MATIIVGNASNMFLEEVKCYLEDKINCKISIAGDKLVGSIDDEAIRAYTSEKLAAAGKKWLREIYDNEYNWSDN